MSDSNPQPDEANRAQDIRWGGLRKAHKVLISEPYIILASDKLFQPLRLAMVSGDPALLIQTLNVFIGVSSCHLAALIRPSRQLG